ncbi:MAG: GGDEF domain-containing protein [Lachnospiraceae bacterium]|nr:GGDEF domain-containing protein [Lachnospiraceae bacterium]
MKIAVLLGGSRYDSQKRLINGILDTALPDGTDVFIFTCDAWSYGSRYKYEKGEYNIYNLPDFAQYDGVIIDTSTIHDLEAVDSLTQRISESGIPCVSVDDKFEGSICISVENKEGTREIAEHLINEHNVGSIYYIAGPADNPDAQERLAVFRSVMEENHIPWNPDSIYYCDYSYQAGIEAVEYFLKMDSPLPEAIMAANDRMAIGAIWRLTEEGFHIPEDIIVTGYSDNDMAATINPRLTTVRKGMYSVAEMAYRKLKQVWNNEPAEDGIVYGKSIFSESCGCARRNYISHVQIQEEYVTTMMEYDNGHTLLKSSAAEFTGLERFRDLIVTLRKYIKKINPDYFYLCTNGNLDDYMSELDLERGGEGWGRDKSAYTDDICVSLAYEKGRVVQYSNFNKKYLLPPDRAKSKNANFYVVLPLHHEDYNFGYCVLGNFKAVLERPLFQHFIMNLCNAMESIRRQEAMKELMQKMNQMWRYDTLTGIYNRAGFHDQVAEKMEAAEFKRTAVTVFFIDMDGLKAVNDRFGHEEGDVFIKAMAEILQETCGSDDLYCRYGGDEFIILTTGLSEVETQSYRNKLMAAIGTYNETHSHEWKIDASIGCYFEQDVANVELNEMIELADQDMYKVKRKKKAAHSNEAEKAV